jgi:hypothetical protein
MKKITKTNFIEQVTKGNTYFVGSAFYNTTKQDEYIKQVMDNKDKIFNNVECKREFVKTQNTNELIFKDNDNNSVYMNLNGKNVEVYNINNLYVISSEYAENSSNMVIYYID